MSVSVSIRFGIDGRFCSKKKNIETAFNDTSYAFVADFEPFELPLTLADAASHSISRLKVMNVIRGARSCGVHRSERIVAIIPKMASITNIRSFRYNGSFADDPALLKRVFLAFLSTPPSMTMLEYSVTKSKSSFVPTQSRTFSGF